MASPIFRNGTLFSIPIPQKIKSPHKYEDLSPRGISIKDVFKESRVRSVSLGSYCHFDPLLNKEIGVFGQASASQTELKNNLVGRGDLFLFFGWFKKYSEKGRDLHHLFGWLQIDDIIEGSKNIKKYLNSINIIHPHGFGDTSRYVNNTIYIGKKNLNYFNEILPLKGHGYFNKSHKDLILTEEKSSRSKWKFSEKYFSKSKNLFLNRLKWKNEKKCLVDCVGYGQEFILNSEDNPKIINWAFELIRNFGN